MAGSPDLKLTFLLPIAVDQLPWRSQSTVPISSSGSQMGNYQVQSNVQAHRKVGAQWVVAPLEPVRASTFFFRDSPPLLTCAFHQTRYTLCLRAWFRPRFDLRCSSKGQDVDPLQASSHSAPPRPTPTATHGGIGRTLSLNASSPPFKVVLTLPNLCVVPRDSRYAKTDMQPEGLKSFVAYSTTRSARAGA